MFRKNNKRAPAPSILLVIFPYLPLLQVPALLLLHVQLPKGQIRCSSSSSIKLQLEEKRLSSRRRRNHKRERSFQEGARSAAQGGRDRERGFLPSFLAGLSPPCMVHMMVVRTLTLTATSSMHRACVARCGSLERIINVWRRRCRVFNFPAAEAFFRPRWAVTYLPPQSGNV